MIEWNENYETGHSTMDAEHRMLITYFNRLDVLSHNPHPTKADLDAFLRFVDFLEDYIGMHFNDEEGLMTRFRCPAHKKNKEQHAEFQVRYRDYAGRLKSEGCHPELVQQLHNYCTQWIQTHILHLDVQMRPCHKECWLEEDTD